MHATLKTLTPILLEQINAYWRAANYISVGQIYLYNNPLLRERLKLSDVKPIVVSHWGTTPGQNFIYVHLNRVIKEHDLNMIYIAGPGHGGPALVGNVYLEGTWSEVYPNVTQDEPGMKKLFKQFSFPGGISSHVAPTTPGSIHEGGELGYSLSHAFGAAFDNPDLALSATAKRKPALWRQLGSPINSSIPSRMVLFFRFFTLTATRSAIRLSLPGSNLTNSSSSFEAVAGRPTSLKGTSRN
jgi:phosphoketolase